MLRIRRPARIFSISAALGLVFGVLLLAFAAPPPNRSGAAQIEEIARPMRALGLYRITMPAGSAKLRLSGSISDPDFGFMLKFSALPVVALQDAQSGSNTLRMLSIAALQPDTYYLFLSGDYDRYAALTIEATYPVTAKAFKTGIHAHRLYNGGDRDAPPSPEPTFAYSLIRDWDISKLHDAEIWHHDDSIDFALISQVYFGHAIRGAKVVKTFGSIPSWAAKRPTERNRYYPGLPGGLSGPRDLDQYENFVYRFISHTKEFLWAVEGWNEPFGCKESEKEFTTMSATELADVQKRLYLAAKRAAPDLPVFSPPQGHSCGIPVLLNARTSQGEPMSDYFDVLAWHAYNRAADPAVGKSYAEEVAQVRRYLAQAGLPKMPIADTEHGWGKWHESGKRFAALSAEQKGRALYDTAKLAKQSGVLMVGWYSYDDEMIGMPMNNPVLSSWLQRIYEDLDIK